MNSSKLYLLGIIIFASIILSPCKLGRFVVYNFADIKDYKKFPSRPLVSNETKFKFYFATKGKYPDSLKMGNDRVSFDKILENNKTVAF